MASIAIEQTAWSKFKQKCSLVWLGNFYNRFNGLVPGARRWINDGWDGKIFHFFRLVSESVLSSSLYMFTFLFGVERNLNKKLAFEAPLHIKLGNLVFNVKCEKLLLIDQSVIISTNLQLNPTPTYLRGPTNFICYRWNFVIANIENKRR